jgi:hypothetical protein
MDIKHLGEFAAYCQQNAHDEELRNTVNFAEGWADMSVSLSSQYGGHGTSMEDWVQEAYTRLSIPEIPIGQTTLMQCHEILTRFWKHGEAFDNWFRSKVIVVTQPSVEQ